MRTYAAQGRYDVPADHCSTLPWTAQAINRSRRRRSGGAGALAFCAFIAIPAARPLWKIPAVVATGAIDLRQWGWASSHLAPYGLEVAEFPSRGLGVRTTRSRRAGEVLFLVPESWVITTSRLSHLQPQLHEAIEAASSHGQELTEEQALAMFLIIERARGSSSTWATYMAMLPSSELPCLSFTPQQLEMLPSVYRWMVVKARERVCELHLGCRPAVEYLRSRGLCDDIFTWGAFRWGMSQVRCRTFQEVVTPDIPSKQRLNHTHTRALIPVADLFNHHAQARVSWHREGNGTWSLVSHDPFEAGAEVCMSYGKRDNLDMLLNYGFVPSGAAPVQELQLSAEEVLEAFIRSHPGCLEGELLELVRRELLVAGASAFSLSGATGAGTALREGLSLLRQLAEALGSPQPADPTEGDRLLLHEMLAGRVRWIEARLASGQSAPGPLRDFLEAEAVLAAGLMSTGCRAVAAA